MNKNKAIGDMDNIYLEWVKDDDNFCLGTTDFLGIQRPKYRCSRCNALFFGGAGNNFLKMKNGNETKIFCYKCSRELVRFLTETVENEFADYGQFG